MANYATLARDAGARIIGGCCGTSPEHVAAMRHALDNTPASEKPSIDRIVEVLGEVSVGAIAQANGQHTIKTRGNAGRRRRSARRG